MVTVLLPPRGTVLLHGSQAAFYELGKKRSDLSRKTGESHLMDMTTASTITMKTTTKRHWSGAQISRAFCQCSAVCAPAEDCALLLTPFKRDPGSPSPTNRYCQIVPGGELIGVKGYGVCFISMERSSPVFGLLNV
jgi:hypothetical protein